MKFAAGGPGVLHHPRRRPNVGDELENPAEEIKRLRRCISDLVSLLSLPAMWSGGEPTQIVHAFLDTLFGMLHLDLVYVQLKDTAGNAPVEMVRTGGPEKPMPRAQEICAQLKGWLEEDLQKSSAAARKTIGGEDISLVSLRLGLHGEIGIIVAGSQRPDFPGQTEKLLLSVAANQASIGLRESMLLSEQKGVAGELDRRVAQRTRELVEANEELELQVGLLQRIPVAAWTIKPDGTPDFVNQSWLEYTGQTLEYLR